MPRGTYMLELELSYNTWTDVTDDWHTATPLVIERGIESGANVAGVGRMTFALHNPDGRYIPGHAHATGGFEAGIGVRLRAGDGVNTHTLFYGRLAAINPRQDARTRWGTAQRVEVVCVDDMDALCRLRLEMFPLLFDAEPRDLVNRLVDASFTPPGLFDYWQLGHPEASKLGQTTVLPGTYTGKDFDTGQSVFPLAGDTWRGAPGMLGALGDVCASEGGSFYIAADGTPVFEDRHARPKHITTEATLSGSLAGLEVDRAAARVTNRVAITVYPREVGDPETVLWTAKNEIKLRRYRPRTIVCRYVDPNQEAILIGAQDMIEPLEYVDYTAYRVWADGSHQDTTEYLVIEAEFGAASAQLTLTSLWPLRKPVYVDKLQVRGTPLRAFQPATVVVEDEDSQLDHGLRPLILDLPLRDDTEVAEDMAGALLTNRKDPHPWITVTVEATVSAAMLAHALTRDVGDRLAVSDADLALDEARCFVEGLRHVIERGGASHRVTWHTSPADLYAYWLLGQDGYGNLGLSTRLGY